MKMINFRSMYKQSILTFVSMLLTSAISFLVSIFLARGLGPFEYGQYTYFIAFSTSYNMLMNFGIIYYIPKKIHSFDLEQFSILFNTIVLIYVILIPFYLLIIYFFYRLDWIYLLIISLHSIYLIIMQLMSSYYIGVGKPAISNILFQLIPKILYLTIVIMILSFTKNHKNFLYILIAINIITLTPLIVKNVRPGKYNFKILPDLLPFYWITLLYGIFSPFSKMIQGYFYTFDTVAILSISLMFGQIIRLLSTSFINSVMPKFSKLYSDKKIDSIRIIYQKISLITAILLIPPLFFFIFNAKLILSFLGDGYSKGSIIFILIIISQVINSVCGPNGTLLLMTDYQKKEFFNGLLKVCSALILTIFTVKFFTWGIALAYLFSEILVNIIKTIQLKKLFGFYPYKKVDIIIIVLSIVISFIVFYFLSQITNFYIWLLNNFFVMMILIILPLIGYKLIQKSDSK